MKFNTRAIHVGEEPKVTGDGTGDVVVPIHLSSTFARAEVDVMSQGYEYSRTANPTRDALEKRLASLESAQFGLAFSSGMAAEATLILSLLGTGDHIIAFDDLYGGTKRLLNRLFKDKYGIDVTYVDARDISNIQAGIRKETKMIWLETPTNPLLKICDIEAIAEKARKSSIITVVDNTFMSPYFQNPLKLGADVVVHSTTKYINGHSDSIGGALMLNRQDLFEKLQYMQNAIGAILSPFDSYLILRGCKTLGLRMEKHQANARKISEFLESKTNVQRVLYPGLKSHSEFDRASRQMSGFGGMVSFELEGDLTQTKKFVESLKIFSIAESLGGVESLVEIPALMTHASLLPEDRKKIGLSDTLIRLSVGIEDVDDLLNDLDQAFIKVFG
jgi:cystathionine gamma-lyase